MVLSLTLCVGCPFCCPEIFFHSLSHKCSPSFLTNCYSSTDQRIQAKGGTRRGSDWENDREGIHVSRQTGRKKDNRTNDILKRVRFKRKEMIIITRGRRSRRRRRKILTRHVFKLYSYFAWQKYFLFPSISQSISQMSVCLRQFFTLIIRRENNSVYGCYHCIQSNLSWDTKDYKEEEEGKQSWIRSHRDCKAMSCSLSLHETIIIINGSISKNNNGCKVREGKKLDYSLTGFHLGR